MVLDITVTGEGNVVRALTVDGQSAPGNLPVTGTGQHQVQITLGPGH
jgi:hypothetical protein